MVYVWSTQLGRITNYCSSRAIEMLTLHILVSAYQETSTQVAKNSMIIDYGLDLSPYNLYIHALVHSFNSQIM
jgi:hypothetical protein